MDRPVPDGTEQGDVGRPGWHVTAVSGWLNDPVGGLHHEGVYHLFFQHVPESTAWAPQCRWAHVSSPDLVRWRYHRVALEPEAWEVGCWSGSAVVNSGVPVLVYTSVTAERMALGRVALARAEDPGLDGWRRDPPRPVLDGPPPGLDVTVFRDPYVWGEPGRWRMVVGAGLAGTGGALLGYSSADLVQWRYTGVVAAAGRDGEPADPGGAWECPQLFDLDGRRVLVVSQWLGDVLGDVVCAVAERASGPGGSVDADGERFVTGTWQRLLHGRGGYAVATFLDAAGRRCAVAWLRSDELRSDEHRSDGEAPAGDAAIRAWEGVLSAPVVLGVGGGAVTVSPHPALASLRTAPLVATGGEVDLTGTGGMADVEVDLPPGWVGEVRLALAAPSGSAMVLRVDGGSGVAHLPVEAGGGQLPIGSAGGRLRLLLDVGVLEVFTPLGGWAATWTGAHVVRSVRLVATGGGPSVRMRAWGLDAVLA